MEKEKAVCTNCGQDIYRHTVQSNIIIKNDWRHVSTSGRGCKNTYAEPK